MALGEAVSAPVASAAGLALTVIAGIGCTRTATGADVRAAVSATLAQHGLALSDLSALAVPDIASGGPQRAAAAADLGVPVLCIALEDLRRAEPGCLTQSPASRAACGVGSASEAAALAAALAAGHAGGALPVLLAPRTVHGPVTCALVRRDAASSFDGDRT